VCVCREGWEFSFLFDVVIPGTVRKQRNEGETLNKSRCWLSSRKQQEIKLLQVVALLFVCFFSQLFCFVFVFLREWIQIN